MTSADMTSTPTASDIRASVAGVVRNVMERDDIEPAVDLFDHGATSLAFIRIVAQVNERYDIELDVAELEEASVDALSALVEIQANGNQPRT